MAILIARGQSLKCAIAGLASIRPRQPARSVRFGLLLSLLASVAGAADSGCLLYDPDPRHLWNRLHETLFIRIDPYGEKHGCDRPDPLYWGETKNLLVGDSHQRALGVLDEFLGKRGEKLVGNPMKRAFLQHDLWALFDWSAISRHGEPHLAERKALRGRLAAVMRRLALTNTEIASLPDNYAQAQASGSSGSLPRGLLEQDGDWVGIGLKSHEAIAPIHLRSFGGRSFFHVLVRLPEGRPAALAYLERLRSFEQAWIHREPTVSEPARIVMNPALPQIPPGTEWALVRRMIIIDVSGRMQPTPFVESIQVRRYREVRSEIHSSAIDDRDRAQQLFKFVASRGRDGALLKVQEDEREFHQLMAHDTDGFEVPLERWGPRGYRASFTQNVFAGCRQCHGGAGIYSVQSYARFGHPGPDPPVLIESAVERATHATVSWKHRQDDFRLLQGFWERMSSPGDR